MLMRLSGVNTSMSESGASEPVYGAETTSRANDPACLGAYVGDHGELHSEDGMKIHLVAAVGNGSVLVVDDGRGNIEPGDLLISSDENGCAMKDDPERFATGNVVARAAERVDWNEVKPDSEGVKHVKLSVLFDSFVRTATPATQENKIAILSTENDAMRARLTELESIVRKLTAQEN
jgi:hypothetical protein